MKDTVSHLAVSFVLPVRSYSLLTDRLFGEVDMKVNILGTEYEIVIDAPDEMLPPDADGAMDHSIKRIVIAKFIPDERSVKDLDAYRRKVLRHEIIHAFLYESGMWNNSGTAEAWGCDETITDWFAIQSPKIYKAFQEAKCI